MNNQTNGEGGDGQSSLSIGLSEYLQPTYKTATQGSEGRFEYSVKSQYLSLDGRDQGTLTDLILEKPTWSNRVTLVTKNETQQESGQSGHKAYRLDLQRIAEAFEFKPETNLTMQTVSGAWLSVWVTPKKEMNHFVPSEASCQQLSCHAVTIKPR